MATEGKKAPIGDISSIRGAYRPSYRQRGMWRQGEQVWHTTVLTHRQVIAWGKSITSYWIEFQQRSHTGNEAEERIAYLETFELNVEAGYSVQQPREVGVIYWTRTYDQCEWRSTTLEARR